MPAVRLCARRGSVLLELVIGIVLGGIVGAAIVGLLVQTLRVAGSTSRQLFAAREAQLALAPFALELRTASLAPEPVLTDSSAAFSTLVLDGAACVLLDGRILIAGRTDVTAPGGAWRAIPDARDLAVVLRTPLAPDDTLDVWTPHVIVDGTTSIAAHGECPAPSGSPVSAAVLTLSPAPLAAPGDSVVLQVVRRVRWSVFRGGDGAWWLGQRRCTADGTTCDPTQPVAGPLRSAAAGGLRLAYHDSAGAAMPGGSTWHGVALVRATLHPRDAALPIAGAIRRAVP